MNELSVSGAAGQIKQGPRPTSVDQDIKDLAVRWGLWSQRKFLDEVMAIKDTGYELGFQEGVLTSRGSSGTLGTLDQEVQSAGTIQGTVLKQVPSFLRKEYEDVHLSGTGKEREGKKELAREHLRWIGLRSFKHIEESAIILSSYPDPELILGAVMKHAQRHHRLEGMNLGLVAHILTSPGQVAQIAKEVMAANEAAVIKEGLQAILQNCCRMPR